MESYDEYEDIGDFNKEITTSSMKCQIWFNRGLLQLYGFNHMEAINCFKNSIKEDPKAPMPFWGISYSLGPHYNNMSVCQQDYDLAIENMETALGLCESAKDWEIELVNSLKSRYQKGMATCGQEFQKVLETYSSKMKEVFEKFQNDLDIAALYAESVMNLRPWQLWKKNGEPFPEAIEAKRVLEQAMAIGKHHQIFHLFIHVVELSPFMREAVSVADKLYEMTKGIGHLLHMPSHIYIQIGDFKKSIESNAKGIEADNQVAKRIGNNNFYTFYRCHNMQFLIWAAQFIGDFENSMSYSKMIMKEMSEDMIALHGKNMEFFYPTYLHVLVRFGKWDEILDDPLETREIYPITQRIQRYARCVAFSVKGMIPEAEEELKQFLILRETKVESRYGNNQSDSVFDVAKEMATGELEYRKTNYETAFNHLRKAIELSDNLIYDEPWDWMQPPHHALGALLLEQGHAKEAEEVYLKDLKTYPKNIWSLTGLLECLEKLGKEEEAKEVLIDLENARKNAKESFKASCFCRKK